MLVNLFVLIEFKAFYVGGIGKGTMGQLLIGDSVHRFDCMVWLIEDLIFMCYFSYAKKLLSKDNYMLQPVTV